MINAVLSRHTADHGLVFGPDPASGSRSVIGGNIGTDACGVHSVQAALYGPGPRTADNVEELEVVTHDGSCFWVGCDEESRLEEIIAAGGRKGEIYAALRDLRDRYADQIRAGYPSVERMPRRVCGYNLDELLPERGFNVARALVGRPIVGMEPSCLAVFKDELRQVFPHDDDAARLTRQSHHFAWAGRTSTGWPRPARPESGIASTSWRGS